MWENQHLSRLSIVCCSIRKLRFRVSAEKYQQRARLAHYVLLEGFKNPFFVSEQVYFNLVSLWQVGTGVNPSINIRMGKQEKNT